MAKARGRTQRRHVREKATIDHLVQDVYKPKAPDEEHANRSPTTSTGLPVEDQVRRELGSSQGWVSHFLPYGMTNLSRLRKRPLAAYAEAPAANSGGRNRSPQGFLVSGLSPQ
jgi:hypothetical protein